MALTKGTLQVVKHVVENGADVNGQKNNGQSVLHCVSTKGTLEIVKHLVEKR